MVRKVEVDQATAIVIFPEWETQAWLPRPQRLVVAGPIRLPWDALQLPQKPGECHPLRAKLNLQAAKISARLIPKLKDN